MPLRIPRLLVAFLLAVSAVLFTWTGTSPAHADEGDKITEFDADYQVGTSGKITVTETINYHFGDPDRHGIFREFITREYYDKYHDVTYTYRIVSVSSPTGAPAGYDTSTEKNYDGSRDLEVKIGDADQYVKKQDETYKIVYTVQGALRTFGSYDELYWDTLGTGWGVPFGRVKITATVPGGAQAVNCYTGDVGSGDHCTSADIKGGRVTIIQNGVDEYYDVTMGIKIKPGLIEDNAPHVVLRSGVLAKIIGGVLTLLSLIISTVGGLLWYRTRGRDQRYLDLPPGTLPDDPKTARTGPTPKIEIPVRFTPPDISVGEAGLLVDGQFEHRDTAATLVDLAVRGAIRLEGHDESLEAVLLDRRKLRRRHEKALVDGIFGGKKVNSHKKLGKRGSLTKADAKAADAARDEVLDRKWFRHVPDRMDESTPLQKLKWGVAIAAFIVLVGFYLIGGWVMDGHGPILFAVIGPLVPPAVAAWLVLHRIGRRGVRTAAGRAVCDQVEGFRTYLATAEAEQLKFEEAQLEQGKDIFSAYLPWAIAFNLADRWTKVCARLVELGRIPDITPDWYGGDFRISAFDAGFITGSVISSVQPIPSSSSSGGSSGSGFGGGSSFSDGGGFSGGGGGGGGGGSW